MPLRRHLLAACLAALPLAGWAAWPERPITIVVPAAAGGTTDIAFGLLALAGTTDAVFDRLQQSARRAMETPEVRQRFADPGGVPGGETPAEYDAFIAQERKSWAQIVKAAGLSLE